MYPNQYCNPCNEPEPCVPAPPPPDCVGEPCEEIVLDTCVRYTGPAIPCLGILTGASLNQVIQIIAARLCDCCDGTPPVINCVVSEWSAWGPCIDGVQTRTRTVIQQPQNGGTACPPLIETRSCCTPVNCVVSAWSAWGPCIEGVETRTRTIVTPASCGGTACPTLIETRECGCTPVDCVVSGWSEWSECNDGGTRTRTRTVITPASCGGVGCPVLIQTESCVLQCVPVTEFYSDSVDCETIELTFDDATIGAATSLTVELVSTTAPTIPLQYHDFIVTGTGSTYTHTFTGVAAGTYFIKVYKSFNAIDCDVQTTTSVTVLPCPPDCGTIDPSWVTFGTWDCPSIGYNYSITVPSSATWATGSDLFVNVQKTGTSEVLIQSTYQFSPTIPSSSSFWTFNSPFGGGQMDAVNVPAGTSVTLTLRIECNEEMIQQTYTYVVPECPVEPTDCVVSGWSAWSACFEGTQTRTRTIITPAANGGTPCPTLIETRDCETPVNCVVSDWSEWSECVEGVQTRTRTVITPASGGGVACPELSESRDCENPPCPPPTDLIATISE